MLYLYRKSGEPFRQVRVPVAPYQYGLRAAPLLLDYFLIDSVGRRDLHFLNANAKRGNRIDRRRIYEIDTCQDSRHGAIARRNGKRIVGDVLYA
jgi:hypothetical protein